jgi:hypothetical protein
MRVLAAFALLTVGCTGASPPSASQAQARVCTICPGSLTVVRASAIDPTSRAIAPALDAADVARRLGRPELEAAVEEKIVTAQAQVQSAVSDDQARTIVDALAADLDRLAVR